MSRKRVIFTPRRILWQSRARKALLLEYKEEPLAVSGLRNRGIEDSSTVSVKGLERNPCQRQGSAATVMGISEEFTHKK